MKSNLIVAITSVREIEKAIERLPRDEYSELRDWIENYELEQETIAASVQMAQLPDEEDGGEDQLVAE